VPFLRQSLFGTCSMKHTHGDPPTPHEGATDSLNALAFSATTHCLTGCAIGEVMGMVAGAALNWNNAVTIAVSTVLAFVFGYAFTLGPLLNSGVAFRTAVGLALASDTLSIAVMEIVDNAVVLLIPGAMNTGLSDVLFWGSLALSLLLAFVAAFPVNRWLIRIGRGHALVHAHHPKVVH
jgi:Domain of unknown function (DUF4396)